MNRYPVPRKDWIWLVIFAILVVLALIRVGFYLRGQPPRLPIDPVFTPTATPSANPQGALVGTPLATAQPGPAEAATPTAAHALFIATPSPADRLPTIAYDRLPAQAQQVAELIARGGPFPYRQDGGEFQNRERLLPIQLSGYYKEYTVETPGSGDRGARRLVVGQEGELYYTADHYASFERVVP